MSSHIHLPHKEGESNSNYIIYPLLVGLLVAIVTMSAPTAVSQSPSRRIVWIGYLEHQSSLSAGKDHSKAKNTIKYRYVEETDSNGITRLVEQKIDWKSSGEATSKDVLILDGHTNLRFSGDFSVTCSGGGIVDLLSDDGYEQLKKLRTQCKETPSHERYAVSAKPWPNVWYSPPTNRIPIPWEKLRDDCSYSEEKQWTTDSGERNVERFSVSASPEIDAVMDVKTDDRSDYWKFVPKPRGKIWFSAHSNIPVRFRFKLEEVSKFPGYATNAYVDTEFFKRYTLEHLQGKYPKGLPDLIFDPRDFEDREVWKKPTGDALDMVETVKERTSTQLDVPVTALDYGAYGRLRAFAKAKCPGEQPVKIQVGGQERDFVTIPMDQDGNLIADRMDKPQNGITAWAYAGKPGRDNDQNPIGHVITGDGLTAFEEYRGFIRSDGHCSDPKQDIHFRTDPMKKDLFIAPDNSDLANIARKFGYSTDLTVHLICPRHYIDNNTRIVNFTLQQNGPRKWENKTIAQLAPQHGIALVVNGMEEQIGPPVFVESGVGTDPLFMEAFIRALAAASGGSQNFRKELVIENFLLHQLGHAVGIRHHGPDAINDAVILNVSSCPPGTEGTVEGIKACMIGGIAVRKGVTSGNQDCPMRTYYPFTWYVPPNASLESLGRNVEFQWFNSDGKPVASSEPAYITHGQLKKYQIKSERPGVGKFCSSKLGTGINANTGTGIHAEDGNHAGDSTHVCTEQICINDVICPAP